MSEIELKDGQIYRWRWADEARHLDGLRSWGSYHCKSKIAIVKGGRLIDTYWSDMSSDRAVHREDVQLTLLCDQSWPTIRKYDLPLYDPADVVDTRHPNDSGAPIYLRPGAVKSAARMLDQIEYLEDQAKGEIRSAQWQLERMAKYRDHIDAGRLDEVMF
jgi:hypothetical protein